jgi:hypothetical protein
MAKASIIFLLAFILYVPGLASAEEPVYKFRENPEIKQVTPKKPVRIKLRRLSGGGYTWEITGEDAAEVLKADRKLRETLQEK